MIDIQRSRGGEVSVNITPLVDIVFQLLIFFLLTAFFVQPEGVDVNLPEAESGTLQESDEIVVVIDAAGAVTLAGVPVGLDELERQVGMALAASPDRAVVVKADRKVALQGAISAMERCKKAGAKKLIIASESPESAVP